MSTEYNTKAPYQDNPVLFEIFQALLKGRYYRATNKTEYDFSKVLKALQENPHLIDSQAENGDTIMHVLAKNQDKTFRDISFNDLFKLGANPFVQNNDGFTPRGLISLRSFPDAYGQISAYESAFQAAKIGMALKCLKDILETTTYMQDPIDGIIETPNDSFQSKTTILAKKCINNVAYCLSGNRQNEG